MVPSIGERTSRRAEVVSSPARLARALSAAWLRLRELFGARAFLQLAQIGFRLVRLASAAFAAADLPVRLGFADQAARHQAGQTVALAHGVVALGARRVAARGGGADARDARAVLQFLDARFGFGQLRARGVELGGRQRAVLHDDDIAGFDRRAFGERQRHDGFVGVGDELHAIAFERAGQGVFVMPRAGGEHGGDRQERSAYAMLHAANSKRMDRSTACTCLVMPPMEM